MKERVERDLGDQNRARFKAIAFAATGVLTGAVYWVLHLRGTSISPDGWGYWQAAVSLLHGRGYTYFSGHPIVAWPPLYPFYLAVFNALLGPTVLGLVLSNSILATAGAVGWAYALIRIAEEAGARVKPASLAAIACYLALFVNCNEQYPLADNFKYALLPWLILSTWKLCNAATQRDIAWWTTVQTVVGIALVLTHNNAVAFVGAGAATVVIFGRLPVFLRCLIAVITSAIPAGCWQIVRVLLDQEGSHLLGLGVGRESAMHYAWQLIQGTGELLTRGPVPLQAIAAVALVVVAIDACAKAPWKRAWQVIGFFTTVAIGATYALFNITWIDDPLTGRYLLLIPFSIVPLILIWCVSTSAIARIAISALVLSSTAVATVVVFGHSRADYKQLEYPEYFVPFDGRISPDYRRGPPVPTPKGLLLAPLQWEETKGRHRGLRDL